MVGAGVGGTATHLILMTDPQAQDLVLAGMIFSAMAKTKFCLSCQ